MYVTCALFGIVIGYFLFQAIAAITMLIIGPIIGYKLISFSFLGLEVAKVNEKFQFRFSNIALVPEINQFIKPNQIWKRIIKEIVVFLVGVGVVVLGVVVWKNMTGEFEKGVALFTTIILGLFYLWDFILIIKLIIQMCGTGFESQLFRDHQEVKTKLLDGVHPKDIVFRCPEPNKNYFSKVSHYQYNMLNYYKELESDNLEEVSLYISKMIGILPVFWSVQYTPYYYEVLYYYTALNKDLSKAEFYASIILNVLEKDKDINGRRVYAAYLYYTGKNRKHAMQVAREGLEVVDKFSPKGQAYMERDLIYKLINEMENNEYDGIFER